MTKQTLARIPSYLEIYVVDQKYENYTPRDHATWRFVMRSAKSFLTEHAYQVYLDGLKKTGIPIDRIPKIEDMDRVLSEFGWGAVCVRGFIPPLAFLDFQARKILPVAADMRTLEHVIYTPAPDIVHEAAGHAPIIADKQYANYLTLYANMARKAIFSYEDIRLYEAIRVLSDTKENPDSTKEDILKAEKSLDEAVSKLSFDSEATLVSRMYWWTAEYGLVGSLNHPKIYGAGLLSSISEQEDCLKPAVIKKPLTLDCVKQSYDITKPQPQLYVAKDFDHLTQVLLDLDATLSYRVGGLKALKEGQRARTVTSTVLDTGIEITGLLESFDATDAVHFVKWSGPVQLCYEGKQIANQGKERHPSGFSAPIGLIKKSSVELEASKLKKNQKLHLEFHSGYCLDGTTENVITNNKGRVILISLSDCTVKKAATIVYDPSWGPFDLAIGTSVTSVYGGPADWEEYGDYDLGKASSQPGRLSPFTDQEKDIFTLYESLRSLREKPSSQAAQIEKQLEQISKQVLDKHPKEWLLGVEIAEICSKKLSKTLDAFSWGQGLNKKMFDFSSYEPALAPFVKKALSLAHL